MKASSAVPLRRLGDSSVSCPRKRCCGASGSDSNEVPHPNERALEDLWGGQKQITRAGFELSGGPPMNSQSAALAVPSGHSVRVVRE